MGIMAMLAVNTEPGPGIIRLFQMCCVALCLYANILIYRSGCTFCSYSLRTVGLRQAFFISGCRRVHTCLLPVPCDLVTCF